MSETSTDRSPGFKLALVLLVAFLLSIPLFAIWLLVYDREQQSQTALASIAEGWGGPQVLSGPQLVIPYRAETSETTQENGRAVTRTRMVWRELALAPETFELETELAPERRARSIYEAVVYRATASGQVRFTLPGDLARLGVERASLALDRAELRFGLSDMRGIQEADIRFNGDDVDLRSGGGNGPGFSAFVDASALADASIPASFALAFRGNQRLSLQPLAGETEWTVWSSWPHPSFQGGFLPDESEVTDDGFSATYRITNLALGRSLVATGDAAGQPDPNMHMSMGRFAYDVPPGEYETRVSLILPVDLYSQVDRSVKYGFLIIGFTFLAYLMFDVIAGVRVSTVEYLLVGAALVLFFVLLLAFAELIGFGWAFIVAAAAIVGLNTSYSAAVLKSWRRAAYIGGLLAGLYAVMFILLSLETFSLLIGSLLLFVALAAIMYATRNIDWGKSGAPQA
ncbi:cell envelope integrity protein CreD [Parasphingopyxis algicola]|uniref:cell envelope integrity protein CreD n=1 Tax=Parasphingopyxis algicola TaxID=2026624 RepID=UPI0015A21ED8|nr:cell envelope integrity protein CreD [Parasphingopyxis algicola]QLC25127.1 cell envelope integrity protein CreD [Parasphingopyxis algicola]